LRRCGSTENPSPDAPDRLRAFSRLEPYRSTKSSPGSHAVLHSDTAAVFHAFVLRSGDCFAVIEEPMQAVEGDSGSLLHRHSVPVRWSRLGACKRKASRSPRDVANHRFRSAFQDGEACPGWHEEVSKSRGENQHFSAPRHDRSVAIAGLRHRRPGLTSPPVPVSGPLRTRGCSGESSQLDIEVQCVHLRLVVGIVYGHPPPDRFARVMRSG